MDVLLVFLLCGAGEERDEEEGRTRVSRKNLSSLSFIRSMYICGHIIIFPPYRTERYPEEEPIEKSSSPKYRPIWRVD